MKYQTEYQRNFQKRTPRKVDDYTYVERKFVDVPKKRSSSLSPTRPSRRSFPTSPIRDKNNLAVIGPNEKFSNSSFYPLRQPVQDNSRIKKSQEYAILGRNEKFQDNVVYPLRRPIWDDSPRIVSRQHRSDNHSCGIQTELQRAPFVSFDPQYGRETVPVRSGIGPQSEYKQQYIWKQAIGDVAVDQGFIEDARVRDRRSDPSLPLTVIDPSEKLIAEKPSVGVNTPARVEIDFDKVKPQVTRVPPAHVPPAQLKRDQISEYQARYKPIVDQKKPRTRKAFEAEQAEERKRKAIAKAEHAHTDNEDNIGDMDLGKDFRQKHSHGNLRRWKSEYETTYKPFWRFDYKNGRWYKDVTAEETGFNPNLFWYKELLSTRKRADEYRANAEADHFNRNHTLQLQTGYGGAKNYRAWDANDGDDDADSVISIDRNAEQERENQRRKQIDGRIQSKIHYLRKPDEKIPIKKSDQIAQTDHQVDRVVYIDEPAPKAPTAATKALVRNLNSSSIQQHMLWDSESLYTQRTNSDVDFKSKTAKELHRKHYTNDESNVIRKASSKSQENRYTNIHSPTTIEQRPIDASYTSPQIVDRGTQSNGFARPSTSVQETRHAAGRSSYDTHVFDKRPLVRPQTSIGDYRSYQGNRYKDEVTDYHYSNNNNHHHHHHHHEQDRTPTSKTPFQDHINRLDERYGQTYSAHHRDDDVLSMHSARSLSSSCSLASETLERAQQNMNKYWGQNSPASVDSQKKQYSARN